jgi:hypothetical protein
MRTLIVLLVLLFCAGVPPAYALRCGNRLVDVGDGQATVLRKCGEPATREWRVIYRPQLVSDPVTGFPRTEYVPVEIEVWLYNFGPQRFMQELSFEAGRLITIEPLEYGY